MTRHDIPLFAWFSLGLLLALCVAYLADPCLMTVRDTDEYWECITGEAIDLSPIQDEADEAISKGRE